MRAKETTTEAPNKTGVGPACHSERSARHSDRSNAQRCEVEESIKIVRKAVQQLRTKNSKLNTTSPGGIVKRSLAMVSAVGWALPMVSLSNLAHRIFRPGRSSGRRQPVPVRQYAGPDRDRLEHGLPGFLPMFLLLLTIMLTGCGLTDEPIAIELGPQPQPAPAPAATDESVQRRFTDSETEQADAVQSALMWSDKYEELSAKAEKLREEKSTLVIENTALKHKLALLGAELDRAKTELAEANDFLHQMQIELTNWKSDVLGFRDEMRNAQAAQLEALHRVLRILGAEPVQSTEPESETAQPTE